MKIVPTTRMMAIPSTEKDVVPCISDDPIVANIFLILGLGLEEALATTYGGPVTY